jgi:hypothetical protein
MDERIDSYLEKAVRWAKKTLPVYGVIAYNKVTSFVAAAFECSRKTVRGILDAHTEASWVFLERNTYPLKIKAAYEFTNELVYNPELHRFIRIDTFDTSRNMLNVVTAEVYNSKGILQFDMSSFFYDVSWTTSSTTSLLELVLVYALEQEKYIPTDVLKSYTLKILDSSCETHDIILGSQRAMGPAKEWHQQTDTQG